MPRIITKIVKKRVKKTDAPVKKCPNCGGDGVVKVRKK